MFICFFTTIFAKIAKKHSNNLYLYNEANNKRGKENEEVIFNCISFISLNGIIFAIGCEKDKSSEVVQQYEEKIKDFEDYQKSAKITDSLETFIGSVIEKLELKEGESDGKTVSYKIGSEKSESEAIEDIVLSRIGYDKNIDINFHNGTLEGKSTLRENGIEMSISTNGISIKYIEVKQNENTESNENAEPEEEKSLVISFDLSRVVVDDEKSSTETRVYSNIKVNETTYGDITRTEKYDATTKTAELISAKIGDRNVDLRLIKATM